MPSTIYSRARSDQLEQLRPFLTRASLEQRHLWHGYDWTASINAGATPPQGPTLFECELRVALHDKGYGRVFHGKKAARMLFPSSDWHDWTEWRWRTFCDLQGKALTTPRWYLWAGAAASGKSWDAVWFAVTWWLMAPDLSAVIMTTTSAKIGRKRLWSVVSEIYHAWLERGLPAFGSFVDSECEWRRAQGDSKHSISLIAIDQGPLQRAVDKVKGHHCERIMVIVDEGDATPEAIFSATANLQAGASREFVVVSTANPESRFSKFGQLAEPIEGWGAVGPDIDEYDSRLGCRVLHFHGLQSPNVKGGKVVCRHLINSEQVAAIEKQHGRDSIEFWRNVVGWFHPEGLSHTVFSEAMFIKSKATIGRWTWYSARKQIAALDPAFTADGDKCVLQFAELGTIADGRMAIQLTDRVIVPINPNGADPVNEQIAHRTIEECHARNVPVQHFILDDTSGGLGDRFSLLWGIGFVRCHFNAAPTERLVSDEDMRRCCDVYYNFVSELWFTARWFLEAGLIKGADNELIREAITRLYWEVNRKKQIEPKGDSMRLGRRVGMKQRVGFSPDMADALCLVCELARQLGAVPKRSPSEPNQGVDRAWEALQTQADELYAGTQPPWR